MGCGRTAGGDSLVFSLGYPLPVSETITLRVNGEERTIAASVTLSTLLEELGFDQRSVAVEYNLDILKRDQFGATRLADGDRLEIVRFVQGG